MLVGFDDDLAGEASRIRSLLTGIHPALERPIGPRITHPAVLESRSAAGGKLVTAILAALDEQTATVPGTAAADTVLPRLADSLKTILQQGKTGRG